MIEVDLAPYGKEGKIILEQPGFRRLVEAQDAMISQCIDSNDLDYIARLMDDGDRAEYTKKCIMKHPAKLLVLNTLCYVKSAPFLPMGNEMDMDLFMDNMTQDLYNNITGLIKANFEPIDLIQ